MPHILLGGTDMIHNGCMKRFALKRCEAYRYLGLLILSVMVCPGCIEEKNEPPPAPQPGLIQVVDGLNQYYHTSPPGKEWKISSISAQSNQVLITVAIPPDQASLIKRQPADDQFRLVADQICPGKTAAVWRQLPAGSGIKVLPSVAGQVFIEVNCDH